MAYNNDLKQIQIKTEYCGSLTQDNDMTLLEIVSEILLKELEKLFKSIESNVNNSSNASLSDIQKILYKQNALQDYLKTLITKRVDIIFRKSIKRMRKCFSIKQESYWHDTEPNELIASLNIQNDDLPFVKIVFNNFKKEIDDLLNSVNLYKTTLSYLDDYKLKKDYLLELVNTKDLSETKLNELKLKIDNLSVCDSNYSSCFKKARELISKKLEKIFSQEPLNSLDRKNLISSKRKQLAGPSELNREKKRKNENIVSISSNTNREINVEEFNRNKLELENKKVKQKKSSKESLKLSDFLNKSQFGCTLCGKVFFCKNNLIQHQKICLNDQEQKISCKLCGKKIKQKYDMRRHMKIHKDETRKFVCEEPYCKKKFREKSDLVRHTLTHKGDQKFKCDLCSERFTQKKSLIAHIRIHTGARPFKCDNCEKAFSRNDVLKSHIKRMH